MTFERFCQLHGIVWHQAGTLQVLAWLRTILHLGDEQVATELEEASEMFNRVGLADPTRSDLVQEEFARHWKLEPPRGYDAAATAMWRKLPWKLAKWVSEERLADLRAVRKCQDLNAEIRRRRKAERGVV